MSGHTPGPWGVDADGGCLVQSNVNGFCVCGLSESLPGGDRERLSNARLIAAAPDGLALAEHIVAMATDPYLCGHPEWDFIVAEAAALLARAEGK